MSCKICRGEISLDDAFVIYVSAPDDSDVDVVCLSEDTCQAHWDELMDMMREYELDLAEEDDFINGDDLLDEFYPREEED